MAERGQLDVSHIGSVHGHAPLGDVVEARHERGESRLARAGLADEGDRLAGRHVELHTVEHGSALEVLEAHVLEAKVAAARRQADRVGPVGDLFRLVHDLEDPLAGGRRALGLADPHSERAQRHHEHAQIEVEGDEAADGELSARHHPGTDQQHRGLRQHRHPRDERDVERPLPVRPHRLTEHLLRARVELGRFLRLLRERLDHVDADDVLLGHRRDVRQLLLHVAERRVGDVAVTVGKRDQDRHHREHDQRELPLEEEQHHGHRDHREHVLEEEDQPVAEEEADALQVDGRPRHQLAGLMAVVEAEGEPNEVRIEPLAHVHLDRQGLSAGDEAPGRHEHGTNRSQDHDRPDVEPELLLVVRLDRSVDYVLRDPDDGDLGDL